MPAASRPIDPYTDTDSSGFVNTAVLLQKKRKSRSTRPKTLATVPAQPTKQGGATEETTPSLPPPKATSSQPKASASASSAKASASRSKSKEKAAKSPKKVKAVTDEEFMAKVDGEESVESMETKSNNGSDNSANTHSSNSDLSKNNSSKNSSSVGGYQASAEITSSNGDVYSVDECSDYIDSNREFCKTFDKEKLMEYRVKLNSTEDALHTEQPSMILEQLNELVFESTLAAAAGAAGTNSDSVPYESPAPMSMKSADMETSDEMERANQHAYAPPAESASAPTAAPGQLSVGPVGSGGSKRSESSRGGDSGFQSGSTYEASVYLRGEKGAPGFSSTGGTSSSMISSNEGSYGKGSSGSSQQGSNGGSSGNNGSSNDGGSSGASNIQSGGSGSESLSAEHCKEGIIMEDVEMGSGESPDMSSGNDISGLSELHTKTHKRASERQRAIPSSDNVMMAENKPASQGQNQQTIDMLQCSGVMSAVPEGGLLLSLQSNTNNSLDQNSIDTHALLNHAVHFGDLSQGQGQSHLQSVGGPQQDLSFADHYSSQVPCSSASTSQEGAGAETLSRDTSETINQIDISGVISEEEMAVSAESVMQFMENVRSSTNDIRNEDDLINLLYKDSPSTNEPGLQSL